MPKAETAQAIRETLTSPNEPDRNLEPANVVDALYAIARALRAGAQEIGKEGASGMGALEGLGVMVREAGERIAEGLHDLAEAIRETRS